MGSVFGDGEGKMVKSIVVGRMGLKFEGGMYVIGEVGEGGRGVDLWIVKRGEFEWVVVREREKIEEMEGDWVGNEEDVCGVVGSWVVGSKVGGWMRGGWRRGRMR